MKRFARTLKLSATGSYPAIFRALTEVERLDMEHERLQKVWLSVAITCGILTLPMIFITGATLDGPRGTVSPVLPMLAVMFLIGAATGIIQYRSHRRMNVDNHRYEVVRAVLRHLSRDMAPDEPVELEIDFNSYHSSRYRTNSTGGGLFSSTSVSNYELPWLTAKGSLQDGNRFRFGVTHLVKRKEKSKRKYTKIKETFRDKISFTLTVRPKTYGSLDRLPVILQQLEPPLNVTWRSANVRGNRLQLQAFTVRSSRIQSSNRITGNDARSQMLSHHSILGLFLRTYHALGLCRNPQN